MNDFLFSIVPADCQAARGADFMKHSHDNVWVPQTNQIVEQFH